MTPRRSFTLVEMMIVVAIVMLLAAIAIPKLNEMQLAAKRGELMSNMDGLAQAERAYIAAADMGAVGFDLIFIPDSSPGKSLRAWPAGTEFDVLGWKPDGMVRCSYLANATGREDDCANGGPYTLCSANDRDCFTLTGCCDVDGNGQRARLFLHSDFRSLDDGFAWDTLSNRY